MGAGPGVRRDTAADGKQIYQLRDASTGLRIKVLAANCHPSEKNIGRDEGDGVGAGCTELQKETCAVLQES